MKKNSVNYCTEKSTLIWHYSNGFSKDEGDIRWVITDLYRTASGEYFLYVSGGPGSDYAAKENASSMWTGDEVIYSTGEAIIPMSQHEVIVWGEENLPDDVLRKVLKDIRQQTKLRNAEIPKILELSTQKLVMREKERKTGLAIAKANQEAQAQQARYYEQFVEL